MKPNTIEFRSTSDNTWVMRITADRRIEVNENVDITFAAQKVLDAMQGLLKPQRTFVGLTEVEINEVLGGDIRDEPSGLLEFVQAIEAKLKEKNT